MVDIRDYFGREQSYVKHAFLENYLENLAHKTASSFDHVVYVDGFAGPWQSSNEKLEDTSFGIALNALRQAKSTWASLGRNVVMSAYLVERNRAAYEILSQVPSRYPEIHIKTYHGDFLDKIDAIVSDLPRTAFAFFLIDPKGWRIPLRRIASLLKRERSEVVFNFMFDFINRAASIADPAIISGLDDLMPFGDWRVKLESLESSGGAITLSRKAVLVDAFGESIRNIGGFEYVAETTILRP